MRKPTIEVRLKNLEGGIPCPGTTISRVLMDNSLCNQYGLVVTGREASIVWSLGIGQIADPKVFFYGNTIDMALRRAEAAINPLNGIDKS